ncbi:hypothetical protein OAJ08_01260 [Candidatus Nitrosopelagicus sp.]|nr:hypothetical protein [Candidatus Nitrosopelagicus sp.]
MNKSDRKRFNNVEASLTKITQELTYENEKTDKRLVRMRFVGITFDPDSYSYGEGQLNDALDHGYKMIRDYPTGAGVVIALGLYKNGAV